MESANAYADSAESSQQVGVMLMTTFICTFPRDAEPQHRVLVPDACQVGKFFFSHSTLHPHRFFLDNGDQKYIS